MTDHAPRARAVPAWSCASLVAGTSAIVWWATGLNHQHGAYRIAGPYHFPILLEIVVGTAAGAAMVLTLAVRPLPRPGHGVAWTSVALLVLAAIVSTGSWRIATLRGEGADIGGGLAVLVSPFIISGLIVWAVLAERTARNGQLRWLSLWLTVAALPLVGGIALWTS